MKTKEQMSQIDNLNFMTFDNNVAIVIEPLFLIRRGTVLNGIPSCYYIQPNTVGTVWLYIINL